MDLDAELFNLDIDYDGVQQNGRSQPDSYLRALGVEQYDLDQLSVSSVEGGNVGKYYSDVPLENNPEAYFDALTRESLRRKKNKPRSSNGLADDDSTLEREKHHGNLSSGASDAENGKFEESSQIRHQKQETRDEENFSISSFNSLENGLVPLKTTTTTLHEPRQSFKGLMPENNPQVHLKSSHHQVVAQALDGQLGEGINLKTTQKHEKLQTEVDQDNHVGDQIREDRKNTASKPEKPHHRSNKYKFIQGSTAENTQDNWNNTEHSHQLAGRSKPQKTSGAKPRKNPDLRINIPIAGDPDNDASEDMFTDIPHQGSKSTQQTTSNVNQRHTITQQAASHANQAHTSTHSVPVSVKDSHTSGTASLLDTLSPSNGLQLTPTLITKKPDEGPTGLFLLAAQGTPADMEQGLSQLTTQEVVNMTDQQGNNLLHLALGAGNQWCAELLINTYPTAMMAAKNKAKLSPAAVAIRYGHTECVEWLLELCDLVEELQPRTQQRSLLHHAAKFGQEGCLRVLLTYMNKRGMNSDLCDQNGNTAAHIAAKYGHLNCIQTLVEFGQDVCLSNKYDHTPCYYADFSNHRTCAGYLMIVEMCRKMAAEQAKLKRQANRLKGPLHGCAQECLITGQDAVEKYAAGQEVTKQQQHLLDEYQTLHRRMTRQLDDLTRENAALRHRFKGVTHLLTDKTLHDDVMESLKHAKRLASRHKVTSRLCENDVRNLELSARMKELEGRLSLQENHTPAPGDIEKDVREIMRQHLNEAHQRLIVFRSSVQNLRFSRPPSTASSPPAISSNCSVASGSNSSSTSGSTSSGLFFSGGRSGRQEETTFFSQHMKPPPASSHSNARTKNSVLPSPGRSDEKPTKTYSTSSDQDRRPPREWSSSPIITHEVVPEESNSRSSMDQETPACEERAGNNGEAAASNYEIPPLDEPLDVNSWSCSSGLLCETSGSFCSDGFSARADDKMKSLAESPPRHKLTRPALSPRSVHVDTSPTHTDILHGVQHGAHRPNKLQFSQADFKETYDRPLYLNSPRDSSSADWYETPSSRENSDCEDHLSLMHRRVSNRDNANNNHGDVTPTTASSGDTDTYQRQQDVVYVRNVHTSSAESSGENVDMWDVISDIGTPPDVGVDMDDNILDMVTSANASLDDFEGDYFTGHGASGDNLLISKSLLMSKTYRYECNLSVIDEVSIASTAHDSDA